MKVPTCLHLIPNSENEWSHISTPLVDFFACTGPNLLTFVDFITSLVTGRNLFYTSLVSLLHCHVCCQYARLSFISSQTQLPIDVQYIGDHPDWRRHVTCIIPTYFRGVIVSCAGPSGRAV